MMFNPFVQNLNELSDRDLDEKISELTRKFYASQRLGNFDLLTQVSTILTMYKEERSKRYYEKLKQQMDGDLDQLINVNK